MVAALIAFLLSLIVLIAVIIYLRISKGHDLHMMDKLSLVHKEEAREVPQARKAAPHPQTPFARTPVELQKLKQQLKQLKYAHSVGVVKKDQFNQERAEIGKKIRLAEHRRENI